MKLFQQQLWNKNWNIYSVAYIRQTHTSRSKMDRIIIHILPTDIWNVATEYLLENIHIGVKKMTRYKYITNTFAKNISYIRNNEHLLWDNSRYVFVHIFDSLNIGMVKYLCEHNKLPKHDPLTNTMCYTMFKTASENGHIEILKYLIRTF